jgi:putative transposase
LLEPGHQAIAISRQCELVVLSKAAYYYKPRERSTFNEALMRLLDEQYTKTPFYGVPKMTAWLQRQGYAVNRKRVRRLMRLMGLEAVYPKPWLSKPARDHKKYPYLLKDVVIERPDHVWSTDITYIRLKQGFIYLVAIMDWHSRYVLSWEISTTLDKAFCIRALEKALGLSSPEIFNSDQGSQFTSLEFTGLLEKLGVAISMDGRSRAMDNIFVERLWRTVKYEEVYLNSYETVAEARESLARYFLFYNTERLHESLGYQTPRGVYVNEGRQEEGSETKPVQVSLHQIQPCFLS